MWLRDVLTLLHFACCVNLDVSCQLAYLQGVQTKGLQFRLVDAKEQVVGRLAAQLSVILQARSVAESRCSRVA